MTSIWEDRTWPPGINNNDHRMIAARVRAASCFSQWYESANQRDTEKMTRVIAAASHRSHIWYSHFAKYAGIGMNTKIDPGPRRSLEVIWGAFPIEHRSVHNFQSVCWACSDLSGRDQQARKARIISWLRGIDRWDIGYDGFGRLKKEDKLGCDSQLSPNTRWASQII